MFLNMSQVFYLKSFLYCNEEQTLPPWIKSQIIIFGPPESFCLLLGRPEIAFCFKLLVLHNSRNKKL